MKVTHSYTHVTEVPCIKFHQSVRNLGPE